MELTNTVAVAACGEYDKEAITVILREHFASFGFDKAFFAGRRVAVKPNLVMKKGPEAAATTHPVVLDALLSVLEELDVSPMIAESPGGVYNRQRLEGVYRVCGIAEVAERHGVPLNYDTGARRMTFADGKKVKAFSVIEPIATADIIIDLCKLKSHSLTKMSAAVKNLFGVIPGIEKFEMHATFPDYRDFGAMLCDLCEMLCREKTVIAVTDAIVGMEGNGPTAGSPRPIGAVLTSPNPFASDLVAEHLLDFDGTVPLVREAVARGLCPSELSEITVVGTSPDALTVTDFKEPDSAQNRSVSALSFFSSGKLGRFFMPRPVAIADKCRACGECVASCPKHTIEVVTHRGKRIAHIDHSACIRCYCCQELCPFEAIRVKKNFIVKIISSL